MASPSYSVLFNGSTDYLSTARILDNSTDLTIESWIYVTATPAANGAFILGQYVGAGADRTIFNVDSTLKVGFQAGAVSMGSTTTLSLNRWYHVAVTRIGSATNNMALYVNGTKEGQMTYTGTFQNTNTTIGYTPNLVNTWLTGYISNLRIVKGSSVYSANFTVPTTPLAAVANTAFLTCNAATIVDGSGNNVTITATGSPTVVTFCAFLGDLGKKRSLKLNGSTQYVTIPNSSLLTFGTGDYTIEAWVYRTTATGRMFVAGTTAGNYFCFIIESSKLVTGRVGFAGAEELISTATVPLNTWVHLAGTRQSGTARIFINGNLDKSGSIATNYLASPSVNYVGADTSNFTNGYISNLRVIKGQCLYTASFTVPTVPLNAVTNTTLMVGHDDSIIDGSTVNFTVTQVAAPTITDFSPFYQGSIKLRKDLPTSYSVSFNGSSALTLTGKSLSGANFTIEGWIYFSTFTTNDSPHFFNFGTDQNNRYLVWRNSGTGKFNLGLVNTGTYTLTDGSITPVTGSWYHLALVRNGSSNYLYVNGSQDATNAAAVNSGTSWCIGKNQFDPQISTHLNGYISNFRVVTGSAVYTTNFTPPTAPLTVINNTALLTANASTIRDASANNYTITASGSAASSTTIPSTIDNVPTLKFRNTAPETYGVYLPSAASYIYTPQSSVFDPGATGAWTLEMWISTAGGIFYSHGNGAAFGVSINCYISSGKFTFKQANGSNADVVNISSTNTFSANTWYHFAVSKDASNVIRMFVNGSQEATVTYSGTIAGGATSRIVLNGINDNNGLGQYGGTNYLSNVRWVKGTALYTSNFTPPTPPLTAVANTQLLTVNASTIKDSSANNFSLTSAGTPTMSLAYNPIGNTTTNRLKIYSVT